MFLHQLPRHHTLAGLVGSGIACLIFNISVAAHGNVGTFSGTGTAGGIHIWDKPGASGFSGSQISDASGARKATAAFVVLGIFAGAAMLGSSAYGRFGKQCDHPWPKVAFISTVTYFVCNFAALVALGVYVNKLKGNSAVDDASIDAGASPLIIGLFLSAFDAVLLYLRFGLAGVCGSGALPEDSNLLDQSGQVTGDAAPGEGA
eukprot:gb/GECG01011089.1/.p1 GENE.gb/GECG01011089.1/~~gb/GECG01011089.1/.p1  ORF type:complete len:204 (+),score=20.28 gb/GECG01011089.1/:1-612(+)